ncbi:uncharacterized protein LOC109539769 [Dendroctonus ponderosae]|uniref:COMM domain-containing protein n=1 Tax=Dendroctonus ponderosae TaxID=77166 RepID=U4U999_DENPD|nr:uncharacterized protein LOC109539769 [Dendroctonus ponderosae]ERL90489.1 hypothetical protein D910_07837 [Dendroctonus ponderosae]
MATLTEEMFTKFETQEELHRFLHNCVNELKLPHQEPESVMNAVQFFYREKAIDGKKPLETTLPGNLQNTLDAVFQLRYTDIVNAIVHEKLHATGHPVLQNIDWKVKWILGSSKLASIREPICQLELLCITMGSNFIPTRTSIHFECDLEKLDQLISVLKKVKSSLIQN